MKEGLKWRIYYGDGTTYDNFDGPPEESPAGGVQAIVCLPGYWYCGDEVGYFQHMLEPGWKIIRFGSLISNEDYARIKQQALADPDFPHCPPFKPEEARHVQFRADYYWWMGGDD